MRDLPSCVCLMGPTAAGKTAAALALAERFPTEIISVDSVQVYRDMNIGTAKPEAEILARIPHHLIDIRAPGNAYSAAEFVTDASELITAIAARGRLPLLAGGTMLYFRALWQGLAQLPEANQELRQQLEIEARELGWVAMHERLRQIDAQAAARIHPNDPQRIQRALEVYFVTGRGISEWHNEQNRQMPPFHMLKMAVAPRERRHLHERIEQRFHDMLAAGLIDEVRGLRERYDLQADLPAMRAVGYRQVWSHLDGDLSYQQMVDRGIAATRQLAKRQLTWLRRESGVIWYDLENKEVTRNIINAVERFVKQTHL